MPVFSFEKIRGADVSLGPEMKSTGECLGVARSFHEALYKAFLGAGICLPKHKKLVFTVRDQDQQEAVPIAEAFAQLGYQIYATRGTAQTFLQAGIPVRTINKLEQPSPNLMDLILEHELDLIIDIPSQGAEHAGDGFLIRRNAIETGVHVLTSLDTARALAESLRRAGTSRLWPIDIGKI